MKLVDIIIIAVLAVLIVGGIIIAVKRKRAGNHGCGMCENCSVNDCVFRGKDKNK